MTTSAVREQGHLEAYRDHLRGERSLSEYTVRNYLNDLDPFFQFVEEQGMESLADVDRGFLRRYVAWLMSMPVYRYWTGADQARPRPGKRDEVTGRPSLLLSLSGR